jgi:signal transduction histidine kinase
MSHELRTPLTAILGYQELLDGAVGGPVNETQRMYLARIKAGAGHLLAIVEEMLTLTRIEAGREIVRHASIDAGQLLEEVKTIVAPLSSGRRVAFRVERVEPAFAFESDVIKVKQVLVNFLTNAFRFTQRGEVVLLARIEGEWAVFEVRDTGTGIPAEHLDRIFDAFWQVEQRMAHRAEGSGLGLAIARQLALLLGGEVTVASVVGEGSTFALRLPRRAQQVAKPQ